MRPWKRNSLHWVPGFSGSDKIFPEMCPVSDIQKPQIFFRPFIPLLFSFICGILTGEQFPLFIPWSAVLSLPAASGIIVCICQNRFALFSPLLLFFCLGCLSLSHWVTPSLPENDISRYANQRYQHICGYVSTLPRILGNRQKFMLIPESLGNGHKKVSGRLRVTASVNEKIPSPGDRICFSGKIRSIRNFSNPGGFDYERYMAFQSIHCTTYARKGSLRITGHEEKSSFRSSLESFRSRIARMIREQSSGDAQSLLLALLIGDKSGISHELRDKFVRSGIAHLLAISGLHMGMISFISFFIFRTIGYRIPRIPPSDAVQKTAAFLSLFPLLTYGMISGLSPATQRAMMMVSLCIAAFVLNHEQESSNTLAGAALLILILHPPTLFSISFQLSFAAVWWIIFAFSGDFFPPFRFKSRILGTAFPYLSAALKSSFFAILGTMPLSMYYFHQFSIAGLAANLLFIPLIAFLVLPAGLFGVFLFLLSPDMAAYAIQSSAFFLDLSLKCLPLFTDIPLTAMKTFGPTVLEIFLFYMLLWSACTLFPAAGRNGKFRKYALPVLTVSLILLAGDTAYWLHTRFGSKALRITVLDVGQGSAVLAEFPGGKTMLIDGGGFYDNKAFDMGAAVVAPFLRQKKIMTLDYMLLSHPESDHMNGLLYIAQHFRVKELWYSGIRAEGSNYRRFMEIVRQKQIHFPDFQTLPRSRMIRGVKAEILWPPRNLTEMRKKEKWLHKENNTSLVLRLSFSGHSFLFPGDIEIRAEKELLKIHGKKLASTVLLAPHHGCASSNSPAFVRQVNPEILIISAGWQNRFRCPPAKVIKAYTALGCRILRTDRDGALSVFCPPEGVLQIQQERNTQSKKPFIYNNPQNMIR